MPPRTTSCIFRRRGGMQKMTRPFSGLLPRRLPYRLRDWGHLSLTAAAAVVGGLPIPFVCYLLDQGIGQSNEVGFIIVSEHVPTFYMKPNSTITIVNFGMLGGFPHNCGGKCMDVGV